MFHLHHPLLLWGFSAFFIVVYNRMIKTVDIFKNTENELYTWRFWIQSWLYVSLKFNNIKKSIYMSNWVKTKMSMNTGRIRLSQGLMLILIQARLYQRLPIIWIIMWKLPLKIFRQSRWHLNFMEANLSHNSVAEIQNLHWMCKWVSIAIKRGGIVRRHTIGPNTSEL